MVWRGLPVLFVHDVDVDLAVALGWLLVDDAERRADADAPVVAELVAGLALRD